jgi:hypothetical protein
MAKRRGRKAPWFDTSKDWCAQLRPWPDDLHFTDGPTERGIEPRRPPRPVQSGDYGSTALQCLGSPFAGISE